MKTAIIMHGNLRTFLMPLRENQNDRISERFKRHIVAPNGADVFIFTDTSDFFYDGVQYYPSSRKIEILNGDACRLYNKVDFIESDKARGIIKNQLEGLLGHQIKALHIEGPYDPKTDPKYQFLHDANAVGSSPSLLIHQWRKLKLCYEMFKDYEKASGSSYDMIVKWRFDVFVPDATLWLGGYDLNNVDAYIAGGECPIVYDWYAFGKRHALEQYMYLYDKLGFLFHEGKAFMCQCKRCNRRSHYGAKDDSPCRLCGQNDMDRYEITMAPEYHLFRLFQEKGIRVRGSGYPAYPYRYGPPDVKKPIDEIIKSLGIGDVTVVNHTASRDSSVTKYEENGNASI